MEDHNSMEGNGFELTPASTPASALKKNARRSERVVMRVPILISDAGDGGRGLRAEAYTVDVSRYGATVHAEREPRIGKIIKIRRIGATEEALARVVDRKASRSDGHEFGIEFTEDGANLWGIEFPAFGSEKAVLRTLLRCAACERQELCYLNEFEADCFITQHSLARLCPGCAGWTVWIRPYRPSSIRADPTAEAEHSHAKGLYFVAPGSSNQRHSERLRTETVGCIRHPTLGNDVVVVRDLGCGGLRFWSSREYPEGEQVEMAVPYSSKAPNVFVDVRIVSSRKGEDRHLNEHGAAYIA